MNIGKLALVTALLTAVASYVGAAKAAENLKLGMGVDQGLSVVAKYQDTYNLAIGNDGMSFDYHLAKGSFSSDVPFTWFVGVGGWTEWGDDFGVRVPLGLDWNFAPRWNLYGHVDPAWQIQDDSELKFEAGFGITYQF